MNMVKKFKKKQKKQETPQEYVDEIAEAAKKLWKHHGHFLR